MPRQTYQQAIVTAIHEEMLRDPSVLLIGQDIGPFEGALQSTKGLWSEFGASGRIVETSLTEAAMMGMGVGAAVMGMRPIVEFMFAEFLGLGMQSLAIDAASMHYFSAGEMRVPLVLRLKCGISPHLGHKQDLHPWLMSVPGIKVVLPSSPYDAKGLMKAAIRDSNPVVVFEHMHLYHGPRQEVPADDYVLPLGVSEIKRAGRDVTIVAIGLMVNRALEAANILAAQGIEAEIIDPRTLHPLDTATIIESVRRTGRLVIAHEAYKVGGCGGEIAAAVVESAFDALRAPILRVAPPQVPIPYARQLEDALIPGLQDIVAAVTRVIASETSSSATQRQRYAAHGGN
jgi:acetoin:2,6-dichlorophenolindophenol oxidoreductase subunit beta